MLSTFQITLNVLCVQVHLRLEVWAPNTGPQGFQGHFKGP